MPATGRKPKPEDQRRNQHAPTHDWIQVIDVPYAGKVPRLPWKPMDETRRWWGIVSKLPHCAIWDTGDWEFAIGTARVHEVFLKTGMISAASELRQREKLLGLTWDARRDLRIKYVPAQAEEEAEKPVSLADRRRELEG